MPTLKTIGIDEVAILAACAATMEDVAITAIRRRTRSAANPKLTSYSVELKTKTLTRGGVSYTYFDQARATRE